MKTALFSVVGDSPLLMHSTKGMTRDGGAKKATTKKIIDADTEAERGTYRDENGLLYLPCIMFKQATLSAAKGRRIGKQYATTLIRGGLIDPDRKALLIDPESGEQVEKYDIDERPVVIGTSRVMRARPRFDTWACDVSLDYDDESLSLDAIADLVAAAGVRVGVGDYRVEKGGWFGRFHVESYNDLVDA